MEDFTPLNEDPQSRYSKPPVHKHKKRGRAVAYVMLGAVMGSLIGGGGIWLAAGGSQNGAALGASAQSYIDSALAEAVSGVQAEAAQISTNGSAGAVAQTVYNEVNNVTTEYSAAVQSVAQTVLPSVVGVRTIESVAGFRQGSMDVEGVGTGVIVSSDGLILTNQHVVSSNPKSITVTLMDGTEYAAQVLFSSEEMDLAVIRIDAQGLTPVALGDSDNLTVGEITIAIGNPLGLEYERSVTAGIVSALGRSILLSQTQIAENLIQTDAAINPGNSGGPLLNAAGEVIGINTYKLSDGEGMGFAIPINAAKSIIEQVIQTGTFQQTQMGVSVLDSDLLSYYDNAAISLDSGLYVYEVSADSDAYKQGIAKADVITQIDGVDVNTIYAFRQLLYQHVPGDTVTVTIERGGETLQKTVMLSAA